MTVVDAGPSRPDQIRARPNPDCYLCGREGATLYSGLVDTPGGAPGEWGLRVCTNPDCRLVWLDPVPVEGDLFKAYRGAYFTHKAPPAPGPARRLMEAIVQGHLRAKLGHTTGVGPASRRWLAPLSALLPGGGEEAEAGVIFLGPPPPGGRVLDVGCGNGKLLLRLRALGWEVEGTDVDADAVGVARAAGLSAHLGELADQGLPGDAFDVAHLGHVVEHLYDPVGVLRECRRVLKPGGLLVVMTPNTAGWGHRTFGRHWRHLDPPRHLVLFDAGNLAEAVRRAGFERVEVRTLQRESRTPLVTSAMTRKSRAAGLSSLGRYGPGWKLRGLAYQAWERALIRFDRQAGEELHCTATKV